MNEVNPFGSEVLNITLCDIANLHFPSLLFHNAGRIIVVTIPQKSHQVANSKGNCVMALEQLPLLMIHRDVYN